MIAFVKSILISLAVLSVLVMLFFFVFQRQIIYLPDKNRPAFGIAKSLGFEKITLHTQDGLNLNAWYHPARKDKPTIVHFHGNGGNIAGRLYLAHQLTIKGYGILLVDYRGYGGNLGSPSEQGLYLDGESAIAFLDSKQIPKKKQIIFGESLGTGVAVEMAARHPACALILQSPFESLPSVARYHYPWIFISPMDKFDSIDKINKLKMPVLILHGIQDTIVPFNQAEALYEKIIAPKRLINFPLGTHINLWQPEFFMQIDRFVQDYCSK